MKRSIITLALAVGLTTSGTVAAGSVQAAPVSSAPTAAGAIPDARTLEHFLEGTEAFRIIRSDARRQAAAAEQGSVTALDDAPTPPQIVKPSDGATVVGSFQLRLSVSEPGGVNVLVDGVVAQSLFPNEAGEIDSRISVSAATGGTSHVVAVAPCEDETCLTSGAVTDSIQVVAYPEGALSLVGVSPSSFSPNGDGKADKTTVKLSTTVAGTVTYDITSLASGRSVRTGTLARSAAGPFSLTWDGKNPAGSRVLNGAYRITVWLATDEESDDWLQAQVILDTVGPTWKATASSSRTVFPRKDGYLDTIKIAGKLNERASDLELRIYNSKGTKVRTFDFGAESVGTKTVTWNGKAASGKTLAAGSYVAKWWARDLAVNERYMSSATYKVDSRILSKRSTSKTVTPMAAKFYTEAGGCSKVATNANGWKGAHGYYSMWYYDHSGACVEGEGWDVAGAEYKLTLPTAVKFGTVKVSGTGQAHYKGSNAVLYLLRNSKDAWDARMKVMGSSYGTYGTSSIALSSLKFGRTVRWLGLTYNGHQYDVKKFKVSWTYYVLVK